MMILMWRLALAVLCIQMHPAWPRIEFCMATRVMAAPLPQLLIRDRDAGFYNS
jgi:hypothetical protein